MTDDLLDRIDSDIAAWEARPESWLPGDPLYDMPLGAGVGEQTVRPMFELIPEQARRPRCKPCGVSWRGDVPCWVCGQDRPALGMWILAPDGIHFSPVSAFASAARAAADFQRSIDSVRFAITRTPSPIAIEQLRELAKQLRPMVPPRLTGPPPLAIDGHAYHHRTRARARRTRRNR